LCIANCLANQKKKAWILLFLWTYTDRNLPLSWDKICIYLQIRNVVSVICKSAGMLIRTI
jgi:hypothetical protein